MFSSSYSHYLFCRKSGRHFVFSAVRRFLLDVNYFKIHNGKFYHKTFRIKDKKFLYVFLSYFSSYYAKFPALSQILEALTDRGWLKKKHVQSEESGLKGPE